MRYPAHIFEDSYVAADPIAHLLRVGRFRVRVVGGAQYRDEKLDFGHFARLPIDNRRLLSRVIHEEFLACTMHLPHRRTLGR